MPRRILPSVVAIIASLAAATSGYAGTMEFKSTNDTKIHLEYGRELNSREADRLGRRIAAAIINLVCRKTKDANCNMSPGFYSINLYLNIIDGSKIDCMGIMNGEKYRLHLIPSPAVLSRARLRCVPNGEVYIEEYI